MSTHTRSISSIEEEVDLIKAAQKDAQAFKPLYEKYFKSIYVFVLHRIGEKSLSADITSQVFLKALLNIGKYKFQGLPFSAWLYRIALNECYDFMRKSSRYRFVSIDNTSIEHLYEELTTESHLEDLRVKLPSLLGRLSAEELHLVELRFFDRRPFKEVADILGITETYAKVKLYRVLAKMKKLFAESTPDR
ncbi:MAG TPA: sigma-70 family RNA polymerase sigma factor [Ohtaekwangia sp.]|nr:sigma-70 family RNA polymerase sigma factor [Ohtaekwangia sp.]